jgi:hypothetical protein
MISMGRLLTVLAGFIITVVACGNPDRRADDPTTPRPDDPRPVTKNVPRVLCRGTQPKVVETCGCSPRDQKLITRLDELKFADDIIEEVSKCADGNADVNVLSSSVFKANLSGCLKEKTKLNVAYQNEVVKLVDGASAAQDEIDLWKGCAQPVYQNLVKCGTHPCPQSLSPFRGVWNGTMSGFAAQPRRIRLMGSVHLTVADDGGARGAYTSCAAGFPLVVTGTIVGAVDENGNFKGTYTYAGENGLPLEGKVALLENAKKISVDLEAPTSTARTQKVDTFSVIAESTPSPAPDPCSQRATRDAGT